MKFSLIFALMLWTGLAIGGAEPKVSNGLLVRVNDAVITYKDVFNRIGRDVEFLQQQYALQPKVLEQKISELQEKQVEEMVQEQLILHEFKTAGFNLPESYIEDKIKKDIRNNFGDRLRLNKTLQAQGLTYESYRKKVRDRIIIEAMWEQNVPRDPVISPHKIEEYFKSHQDNYKVEDQVKLRMIVVTNRPNDTGYSPKKLAGEILAKILEGTPFSEMAVVYSQGTQRAQGGDWGWVERSLLRADLGAKAFTLKSGQQSDVVEATDGCYLMFVEEARPAHVKPLSEVRDEIESTLKSEESKRLRKRWIDRLKAKSFVRYY